MASAVKKSSSITKQIEKFRQVLESIGFDADTPSGDSYSLVRDQAQKSRKEPWSITSWSLTQGHGSWSTEHLSIDYQLSYLSELLRSGFSQQFGDQSHLELIPAADQGVWVLLEVFASEKAQDDRAMVGTVGFRFDLTTESSDVCLQFSKHFLIGTIPEAILTTVPKIFMDCFSFPGSTVSSTRGLFECRIDFQSFLNHIVSEDESLQQIVDAAFELGSEVADGIKAHLRCSFDGESWQLSASTLGDGMYEFDVPPIEIVESRELGNKYLELEQLMLSDEPEEAKAYCIESLDEEPDSLFLLRRLCLINMALGQAVDDKYLHTMMNIDSDNLLFLSAAAQSSILTSRGSHLLKFLSKMGQILNQTLTNFEDLKTMDVVLPELLGDGWSEVNVQTAQACYQRVLAKRGDVPRVLWKMVQIARRTDDRPAEIALLERLVEVEENKQEAATCYMRLADLQQVDDIEAAANSSLKGWKLDPVNTDYAEIASYNLVQIKDYEKAVRVLDDCRKLIEPTDQQVKKVDLELLIARIWFTFLKRKDLAKLRIEHAVAVMPDDIESLKRCEDISEEFAETVLLVDIRESLLSLSLRKQNREEAFRVKEGLKAHFAKVDESGAQYARICEKVLEVFLIDAEEIAALFELDNDIPINWLDLVNNLQKHISDLSQDKLQEYLIITGLVYYKKINDKESAAQSFEAALKVGSVDNYIYDFLNEYYADVKQLDRRDFVLKHQLKNAADEDRVSILKELFYTASNASDAELDNYAIKILKEGDEDAPVKKRFITYQERSEIEEIDQFLSDICAEIFDRIDQFNWMKYALDCLNDCEAKEKYELIEKILRDIKPYYKDIFEWYEAGVSYHKSDKKYRYLEPYLNKLILNGIPPELDKRITLQVLKSNPIAKGLFYRYLANQEEQTKEIAACLRQALAYLTDQAGYETTAEGIISQLADIVILTKDEMAYYQKLTKASDNHDDFYRIVDAQLRGLSKKDQFDGIRELAFSIVKDNANKTIDFVKSMLKCVESFDAKNIESFRFDLLEINEEYRKFLPEVWGIKFLRNLSHWSDEKRYKLILEWILNSNQNRDAMASIFKENMIKLRTKRDFESLDRYAILAKSHGFSFNTYNWFLFQNFYKKESLDKARFYWHEFIKNMTDVTSWKKFYRDTCELLQNDADSLTSFLREAYEGLSKQLADDLASELGTELGINLFHQDRETELAYRLLNDRFNKDSTDQRCWIPLYFLNSILKKKDNQYQLLYQVIPKLEKSPALIGDYPTTIAAIHKDFVKVARQLNKSDQIEGYQFGGASKNNVSSDLNSEKGDIGPIQNTGDQAEFSESHKKPESSIGFQVDSTPMDLGSLFASSDLSPTEPPITKSPIPLSVRNIAARNDEEDEEEEVLGNDPEPVNIPPPTNLKKPDEEVTKQPAKNDDVIKPPQSFLKRSKERLLGSRSPKEEIVQPSAPREIPEFKQSKTDNMENELAASEHSLPAMPESGTVIDQRPKDTNDWREWVRFGSSNLFERVGELSFDNRVSKYLAMQAAALKEKKEPEVLKNFKWLDFVEPWDGNVESVKTPLLDRKLYQVVQASQEFLAELYQEKYSLRTISRVFGLTIDRFLASRASIQFTELFSWPWAENYQKILNERGISIVFIEGPQKVLFEARKSKLYVSQSLAISPNPDLLFHILYILRAMDLGLFEIMMLKDRVKDPFIEYLQRTELEGIDQATKDDVIMELQKPDEINNIVAAIRDQIFTILLTESRNLLDLASFEVKQEPGKTELTDEEVDHYINLAIKLSDDLK